MNGAVVLTTLLFTTAALVLWVASICALRWEVPGLRGLVAMLFVAAMWCVLDGLWQILPPGEPLWLLKRVEFLCYAAFPLTWLYLLLDYRSALTRRSYLTIAAAAAVPVCTLLLVWTNQWHHLIFASFQPYTLNGLRLLRTVRGPWFFVHVVYGGLLGFVCKIILWRSILPGSSNYRLRVSLFLAAVALPGVAIVASLYGFGPAPGFDWSSFGVAGGAVLLAFGLGRFRFFDLVPVAYDQVLRVLPDAVLVLDSSGRILTCNPAASALFGQALSIPGTLLAANVRLEGSDHQFNLRGMIPPGGDVVFGEGSASRSFRVSVTPLRVRSLFQVGRIFLLSETTQDRDAQRELEASRLVAVEANRAKSEFLAVMSHELRTPLNAVIGSAGLLMETSLEPDQWEYAGMIRNSGQSLLRVINDILDLSKIESGRMSLERIEFNLRSVVEDCVEVILPGANQHGLTVTLHFDPECAGMYVGDPARIRQILINFLSNASKFTEQGVICVDVQIDGSAVSADPAIRNILVSIEDSGIGIDPASLPLIFESFRQADTSTTRRFGGTGLGLAICRKLSLMMGGEVGCESEPGRGSRFWCRIPLAVGTRKNEKPHLCQVGIVMAAGPKRDRLTETMSELGAEVAFPKTPEEVDPERAALLSSLLIAWHDPAFERWGGAEKWCRAVHSQKEELRLAVVGPMLESEREAARAAGVSSFFDEPWLVRRLRSFVSVSPVREVAKDGRVTGLQLNGRSPSILLAEDNEINRRIATIMLGDLHAELEIAVNGRQAVEMARLSRFDLVLMDLQMPEMGGLEATKAIRAFELESSRKRVPICALTAGVLNNERERCLEAGMDDFLAKPIMKAQLLEVCRRWLFQDQYNDGVDSLRLVVDPQRGS
jgi:signal transduction histidine kinase/CheY-like chemotaxis protein